MPEQYHRLLSRQIKKLIPAEFITNPDLKAFFGAINEAYNSYDTEYKQLEHIFELSSKESFKELTNIQFALDQTAAVFIIDSKQIIQYANENFCKITGHTRDEIIHQPYTNFFKDALQQSDVVKNITQTIAKGKVWKGEIQSLHKEGSIYWTDTTIVPILNNEGVAYQLLFISIDITIRKNAEEELRKLSLVADKTDNGVVITDAKGMIEWVNKGFTRITGYELAEVVGLKPGSFLQGERTNPETRQYIREQLALGNHFEVEILNYAKDGRTYWVNTQISPIKNAAGAIESFIAIQLDVTKRKEYELKLILLERLLQHTSDIVQIIKRNGDFFFINETGSEKLGYSMEELQQMNIKQIELLFKDPTEWDRMIEEELIPAENGLLVLGELKRKDESSFPVEVQANYVKIDGENYIVALSRDIASRLEMEKKKEEAIKDLRIANQELNDFAYIVSHDLKAPLRAIGSLSSWLQKDYQDKLDQEGKTILELLNQRTHRMHHLIEGVLNYSKVGREKNTVVLQQTEAVVDAIIDGLGVPNSIQVTVKRPLPEVYYEEVKYGQVFQNLISNAIKYMDKPEGWVEIGANDLVAYWEFYVADNGPGIEPQHFDKIFRIFQTLQARDEYESTGIGLTIVKKIVETNGGTIRLSSTVKVGTTFYFTVPKKRLF